jgi:hypothetical protein
MYLLIGTVPCVPQDTEIKRAAYHTFALGAFMLGKIEFQLAIWQAAHL